MLMRLARSCTVSAATCHRNCLVPQSAAQLPTREDHRRQMNEGSTSESSSSSEEEEFARHDSTTPPPTREKRRYKRKRSIQIVKKFKPEKKDQFCIFGEYVASEIRNIGSEFYMIKAKECINAILFRAKAGRLGGNVLAVLNEQDGERSQIGNEAGPAFGPAPPNTRPGVSRDDSESSCSSEFSDSDDDRNNDYGHNDSNDNDN